MNNKVLNVNKFKEFAQSKNCLVVGDIILDRYIYGEVNRISPESPVPVVNIIKEKHVLGGAANVAGNIHGFYMKSYLCGRIGNDIYGLKVKELLEKSQICFIGIASEDKCTTNKTRVIGMNQQIVRIDEEDCHEITAQEEYIMMENIIQIIDNVEVVVLSDYNKGICTENICQMLISLCNEKQKVIIIDPKSKDWLKYTGATVITPNFKEFKEVVGSEIKNQFESILHEAKPLMQAYNLQNLLVTRSNYGMMLVEENGNVYSCDSVAQEVYDVSGAGDTVIATLAAFLANGYDIEEAVKFSNHAAGFSVSKAGTYMVTLDELYEYTMCHNMEIEDKIVTYESLMEIVAGWKQNDKKIVFTNGCFDILHIGHIKYLQEASKRGDKLIIGLNTDNSVKKLKGENRPITIQRDRGIMIAALQCVDLVVFFDEEIPYNLIKMIKPDLLVKGGDYKVNEIIGKEFANNVEAIPFLEGYSTTGILTKILNLNE